MFWELINELTASRGMTVLVTTHYTDEAEQCDRLALMLGGQLIAEGRPNDLKERLATTFGALYAADPSLEDVFVSPARQQSALASAGESALAAS
jgi:ABC-2 type transport system ATP-binding protein